MKSLLLTLVFLCLFISINAQVAINSNNASPDSSAMLDVQSTDKGLLIPRMTSVQRSAIDSPVQGLLLYQTDVAEGLWSYNGAEWKTGSVFTLDGNTISNGNGSYIANDFVFGSPSLNFNGNFNHNSRMLFDKDKSAFRAGYAQGGFWDVDSVGFYSVAFGYNTKATNNYATSLGFETIARGNGSTALGSLTSATGVNSTSMGNGTAAGGAFSTALGLETIASGTSSTSMGKRTIADGNYSTAMGSNTSANGLNSTSMGKATTAGGNYSTAMGYNTTSNGFAGTVIGLFNEITVAPQFDDFTPFTPLLIIGNGSLGFPSNAMVVRKDGRVGIGTSAPTERLHVSGGDVTFDHGITTSGLTRTLTIGGARNGAGSFYAEVLFQNLDNNNSNVTYTGARISSENSGGSDDGDLRFATNNGTLTTHMILNSSGKLGLGNTAPIYNLHVGNGNITALNGSNTRIAVTNGTNGQRAAFLGLTKTSGGTKVEAQLEANGSNNAGPSVIVGSASTHPLYLRTGNLTRMTIDTDGDVGIGTSSPGWKLEVNGDAAKSSGGSSWTVSSDRRLKHDIRDFKAGLVDILRIRPVQFRYNAISGYNMDKEHVGVIAQELQEISPHMIGSIVKDGVDYLTVNNSAMTYMLINAVQELNSEKAEMQATLDHQQQQLAYQQEEIEALKKQALKIINSMEKLSATDD